MDARKQEHRAFFQSSRFTVWLPGWRAWAIYIDDGAPETPEMFNLARNGRTRWYTFAATATTLD
jgi:hypothetical protein